MPRKALLITDVTRCFCLRGELAVTDGDQVVDPINSVSKYADNHADEWALKILTRDWHDKDSEHFKKWPVHGVKFSRGSEFHPKLTIRSNTIPVAIVSKGLGKINDGYSPFDPASEVNIILVYPDGNAYPWEGDLESLLRNFSVDTIMNSGLATDYCVKSGSIDSAKRCFNTYLLIDACRTFDLKPGDETLALNEMVNAGVKFATTDEVICG